MTRNTLALAFVGIGFLLTAACTVEPKKDPLAADGGTGDAASSTGPISCYIANQFVCDEIAAPSATQKDNLEVSCSSGSGVFSPPAAACPPAGFLGKCTSTGGNGLTTRRYYQGAEVAYWQDFCVNTAQGVWSTTF